MDVGRIDVGSQRCSGRGSPDRNDTATAPKAGDAGSGSLHLNDLGQTAEGGSVSSGESEVLYCDFADGGHGECVSEGTVGI